QSLSKDRIDTKLTLGDKEADLRLFYNDPSADLKGNKCSELPGDSPKEYIPDEIKAVKAQEKEERKKKEELDAQDKKAADEKADKKEKHQNACSECIRKKENFETCE